VNIYRDTNPRRLTELLSELAQGDIALPDFQRSFVWKESETAGLLASLARSFPAGSLLRIENRGEFAQRAIEGAPPLTAQDRPRYLLLDGQQRLTSLYQALYGSGDHEYFLDLKLLSDDESAFEGALLWEKRGKRAAAQLHAQQYEQLVLPLAELRNAPLLNFQQWIMRARYEQGEAYPQRQTAEFDQWQRQITQRWIHPFEHYQFPIVTLSERVGVEAVCTIFETLNRTGVKLTPFELLTARFYISGVNLRTLWEQALDRHPILEDFEITPYQLLQAIVIATGGRYAARGTVLQLRPEDITELWQPVVDGCAEALYLVQERCGVVSATRLPGDPVIVGMAAAYARLTRRGFSAAQLQRPLLRWYWNVVLADLFVKGTNTRLPKEVLELCSWLEGGALPESMARFRFDKTRLLELSKRDGNLYKAIVALLAANRPRSLEDGQEISAQQVLNRSFGMHELLPAEALTPLKLRGDAVVNQMVLRSDVARKLRSGGVADYLNERRQALGDAEFQAVIDSHLISREALQALSAGDVRRFCSARSETIYERIMYLVN
jgi:hypothetical protein